MGSLVIVRSPPKADDEAIPLLQLISGDREPLKGLAMTDTTGK